MGKIYSLKGFDDNSDHFYRKLNYFTQDILDSGSKIFSIVENYKDFLQSQNVVEDFNNEEYLLEALSIGVYWINYIKAANRLTWLPAKILKIHFYLRRKVKFLKPYIDLKRGILATIFLRPFTRDSFQFSEINLKSYNKLVNWLQATGEFKEECVRFKNWSFFLDNLSEKRRSETLTAILEFARIFQKKAETVFHEFTNNVNTFITDEHRKYYYREDVILSARRESDYHLIMFGAEILNRASKEKFSKTKKKIVLLPGCMRSKSASDCPAKKKDLVYECIGCSNECKINKIRKIGIIDDLYETLIIPHSSDFTDQLRFWSNQSEIGLVASACVLHLFTGGYEMKQLNIPSQCIFLEYPGCKKHWTKEGIPTEINLEQLIRIIKSPISEIE